MAGAGGRRARAAGEPNREQQRACGGDANGEYDGEGTKDYAGNGVQNPSDVKRRILDGMVEKKTIGRRKPCACATTETRPCVVLDPFTGSGTTGAVATRLLRSFIGCELNPEYVALNRKRIGAAAPLFATEVVE